MIRPRLSLAGPCFLLGCLFVALSATPCFAHPLPAAVDSVSNAAPALLPSAEKPGMVHVEGVIQDASGGVLPAAKAHFAGDAGFAADIVADASGSFRIDLPAGTYRVSAVEAGYQQVEQPLELHAGAGDLDLEDREERRERHRHCVRWLCDDGADDSEPRVPIRVLDLPQSTYTVTHQLLEDRGANSVKDALAGVPGVQPTLGEGRRDSFDIRGFSSQTDQYIDGVRDEYFRDLSNTEQLDVVEGPAAVLYGRGSSGGLVNRVTKKPTMEGVEGYAAVTGGSYGERRVEADASDSWLHNTLGGRLTGAGEYTGSQRHYYYYMNRYALAPTLRWRPSDRTDMYVQVVSLLNGIALNTNGLLAAEDLHRFNERGAVCGTPRCDDRQHTEETEDEPVGKRIGGAGLEEEAAHEAVDCQGAGEAADRTGCGEREALANDEYGNLGAVCAEREA
jgi:catecholate siderophore receptor